MDIIVMAVSGDVKRDNYLYSAIFNQISVSMKQLYGFLYLGF